MLQNGGKGHKVSHIHNIAIYEATTGRIVHMHRAVVFEGSKSHSVEDAQREALEHARRIGHDVGSLKAIAAPHDLAPGHLKVDVAKNAVISTPVGFHRPQVKQR